MSSSHTWPASHGALVAHSRDHYSWSAEHARGVTAESKQVGKDEWTEGGPGPATGTEQTWSSRSGSVSLSREGGEHQLLYMLMILSLRF